MRIVDPKFPVPYSLFPVPCSLPSKTNSNQIRVLAYWHNLDYWLG
ncbi:hypothetical protein [Moorena producens]